MGRTRSETLPISSWSSRALMLAAVTLSPSCAGERARVDAERDRQARLVDRRDGQRARVGGVGDRLADRDLRQPRERDDLARARLVGRDAVERLGDEELDHARGLHAAVGAAPGHLLALAQHPVMDAQQREPADVLVRVEVRDERLQRVLRVVRRRRDRRRAASRTAAARSSASSSGARPGVAGARVRVDDRELDLLLARVEVDEELVDLVDDLVGARVGPVDLVDDEHDRQAQLERLAQHEPRLRQRALGRVDEQQHAVDHRQAALDLAAEVGVAGRVDDVDLHVAVLHGRVLGEDRDALLALEVVRVHDALVDVLVLAEGARLPEHRVDERRLPVVDVGDDRDVAQVVAAAEVLL